MKKIIFLLVLIIVLVAFIGCSDDDKKNSSPTGVDFTDDDILENVDYYMFVSGTDYEGQIMIFTKKIVTTSELIINGGMIDINDNWIDVSLYIDEFAYGVNVDESMLPAGLIIEPGTQLDIKLKINGSSYNNVMTVASLPNVALKTLDLGQDFNVTWSLNGADPMTQVVMLEGGSYFGNEEDDFDKDAQVKGNVRSYTFPKSIYSDYSVTGLDWYDYGVDAINYKKSGKFLLVLVSSDTVENYGNDGKNTKFIKPSNIFKAIQK